MVLAMALTFSCSHGDENPFAIQYLYCVNPVEMTCVPGPFYECPQGAAPKDVCPAEFVEKAPSSSSGGRSSSSGGSGDNDPLAGVYEYFNGRTWFNGMYTLDAIKEFLKYYNPDRGRCRNGVVEWKCEVNGNEDGFYSPLTHVCVYDGYYDGVDYDKIEPFEHCGNKVYLSNEDVRCQDGVLEGLCGDVWLNPETHYCYWSLSTGIIYASGAKERCGSKYYEIYDSNVLMKEERCRNGVVETTCGGRYDDGNDIWYNPETQYCSWDENTETNVVKAIERCGNGYIDRDDIRCNNGVIEWLCNGDDRSDLWFNFITQSCDWDTGIVKAKVRCGS
jgi:hypothetical protein